MNMIPLMFGVIDAVRMKMVKLLASQYFARLTHGYRDSFLK